MEYLAAAIGVVAVVLGFFARAAIKIGESYVERKLNVEIDDSTRSYLEDAFQNALEYGAARVAKGMAGANADAKRQAQLEAAATYVMDSVPDALARFGITAEGVQRRLEARIGVQPAPINGVQGGFIGPMLKQPVVPRRHEGMYDTPKDAVIQVEGASE